MFNTNVTVKYESLYSVLY